MVGLFALSIATATVSAQTPSAEYAPADPKATPEVRALLNRFKALQGQVFVSGQTDYPDALWVEQHTGKLPVILALDFMHVPSRMGARKTTTAEAIEWAKERAGVVTYRWHWVSPSGTDNPGKGFYTDSTSFDLAKTLAEPDSADYKGLIQDIDEVAAEIAVLGRQGIPIIFRPLHEAQGKWFWWGAKGAEPCVELYHLIFERLTGHHDLHNIAWAWTAYPASHDKGDPAAWYPGDDKVDFVVSDYCESPSDYAQLVALTAGRKMVALSETMNAPHPDAALAQTPWAYWVTWARRDWNDRSEGDMKRAMAHPKTLTLGRFWPQAE